MYDIEDKSGELVANEKALELTKHIQELNFELLKSKNEMETFKEELKEAMEKYNVTEFENDYIKVKYIPEHEREIVNVNALKEQGLYDNFKKVSKVKASIRTEIKDD
jgi:formylmethanofuran dehydrogenase subunit A